MALNPCYCGISMQMACKIIAFVQMLSCTFSLVTGILGLTGSGNVMELRGKEYDEKDDLLDPDVERIVWSIVIGVAGVGLILAILLFQAARKKKRHVLFIWFFLRCIVIVMLFVKFVHDCIHVRSGGVSSLIVSALNIFLDMYCAFVVWCYWQEVKTGEGGGTV